MTTYTWTSAVSGNWTTTADWSPAGGPQNGGDTAYFVNGTGPYTVTYNSASFQVGTILAEDSNLTLLISAGSLVSNTLTEIAGATIDVGAGAHLSLNTSSGFAGVLNINGGTVAAGALSLASTTTIDLGGSGGANGRLTFYNNPTLASGAVIEATGGTGTISTSGSIVSFGVIEANGGTLVFAAPAGGETLTIGNSAASVMDVTGAIYYGGKVSAVFQGSAGTFAIATNQGHIVAAVSGLNAGAGISNVVDFTGDSGLTVTSGGTGTGTGGSVVLSNGNTLALSGITESAGSAWAVVAASDGGGGTEFYLQSVCYAQGTHILTDRGDVRVEELRAGDQVVTLTGEQRRLRPVRWIGHRRLDLAAHPAPESVAPIRIARGAVADAVPGRDLLVSPDHAILLDGVLICARQLVNGETIRRDTSCRTIVYYHVELDAHAILLAEGLTAESYLDTGNRSFFANAGGPLMLHPRPDQGNDNAARMALSCAPLVSAEAAVRPIWQRLAQRAACLRSAAPGLPAAAPAACDDPGLSVLADGRRLTPIRAKDGHYAFVVPAGTGDLRLLSRSGRPADTSPWAEDQRRLGVYVERLSLRDGRDCEDIPLDHAAFGQGWWPVEREGRALRRWTDGDARLPLRIRDRTVVLEVVVGRGSIRYLTAA
jgi:hypothetical protein